MKMKNCGLEKIIMNMRKMIHSLLDHVQTMSDEWIWFNFMVLYDLYHQCRI